MISNYIFHGNTFPISLIFQRKYALCVMKGGGVALEKIATDEKDS
jgi:hypothetical protein